MGKIFKDRSESWMRVRILLVTMVTFCLFILVTFVLTNLVRDTKHDIRKLAESQYKRMINLQTKRGDIRDRSGEVLATSTLQESVYLNPQLIKNKNALLDKIAKIISINKNNVRKKLTDTAYFVWLKREISDDEILKLKSLKEKGIGFIKEYKRSYPHGSIASQTLGFVGIDSQALGGLELWYNDYLSYELKGDDIYDFQDALGRGISLKQNFSKKRFSGYDIILTIDKDIQYSVENELQNAVRTYQAERGHAIIVNPETLEILALANYPNFDPNSFRQYPQYSYLNNLVSESLEPGSTFKIFLMAGAIEEKIVSSQMKFFCENGSYRVRGKDIHDVHAYGMLTVEDIIKYSSNIGACKIGAILGKERLSSWMNRFGFGQKTLIDFPAESTGLLKNKKWNNYDLCAASFGQGFSASALQLVTAASTIANGGKLLRPYLVREIIDEEGKTIQRFSPTVIRRVVSRETTIIIKNMLDRVVNDRDGTGSLARLDEVRLIGKTGTSQKYVEANKTYSRDKLIVSFLGFFPKDEPRYVGLILLDEPKTMRSGGLASAPTFKNIAKKILHYETRSPDYVVVHLDKNKTHQTLTHKPAISRRKTRTHVEVSQGKVVMPDLTGLTIREVFTMFEDEPVNVYIKGSGFAYNHVPKIGERLGMNEKLVVYFKP